MVAIKHGLAIAPPLLLFNGIGANWELAKPFLEALDRHDGDHLRRAGDRRLSAAVAAVSSVDAGAAWRRASSPSSAISEIDVAGVSWGGGIAQQFAHQYPKLCRRLVLAATSPGAIMVPASPSVLWKMATPRRYIDKDYMRRSRAGNLRRSLSRRSRR